MERAKEHGKGSKAIDLAEAPAPGQTGLAGVGSPAARALHAHSKAHHSLMGVGWRGYQAG